MSARGRLIGVLALVLAGGLGVISATQTWFIVTLAPADDLLEVSGADAVAVLAPLSLTVLALAGALAIAPLAVRYVLAALAAAAAVALFFLTVPIAAEQPLSAVASAVTEATGLAGAAAVSSLVRGISATSWPVLTQVQWLVLAAGAIWIALTAHRWRRGGSRFRTHAPRAGAPLDAVDSWDELSRGADPTGPER